MTLSFPTLAEQALAAFRAAKLEHKTVSLREEARKRGGTPDETRSFTQSSTITYVFDDDSTLMITGRGRHHCYETQLP